MMILSGIEAGFPGLLYGRNEYYQPVIHDWVSGTFVALQYLSGLGFLIAGLGLVIYAIFLLFLPVFLIASKDMRSLAKDTYKNTYGDPDDTKRYESLGS